MTSIGLIGFFIESRHTTYGGRLDEVEMKLHS